ncbi:MAG: hypothetical protein H0Z33_17030 [Bacillaceae bacterium]|nr:hypothetical protein [Bacillaceae bacterium]
MAILKKKLVLILTSVFLIVASSGYLVYHYFFNRDVTPEDVHVSEEFFDFSSVIDDNPVQTDNSPTPALSGDPTALSDQAPSQQTGRQDTDRHDRSSSSQPVTAPGEENSPSSIQTRHTNAVEKIQPDSQSIEQKIRDKYYVKFNRLKNLANARLDELFANGYAEYKQSKKTGEPPVADVISRYSSAAKKLQKQVDATFYLLLDQMKNELKANGLPMDLADEAEATYRKLIEQKKAELKNRVMKD